MLKKKVGRLTNLIVVIGLVCMCILPVSANYLTMLDHGMGYWAAQYFHPVSGAGASFNTNSALGAYWALESFDQDYTYTFTFVFQSTSLISLDRNNPRMYFARALPSETVSFYDSTTEDKKSFFKLTVKSAEQPYTLYELKVVLNPKLSGISAFPLYYFALIPTGVAQTITTVSWGASAEYDPGGSQYIQDLVDEVATIRQNDETYHSNALEVLDGIKSGIDGMPGEIKDVLEQHDQDVKQEASTEGNDNITQATSALTNALPVASISDAIAPLVTACGYNGITSVWSFPAMKIPAIAGLFEEIQLNEVQNFDLCICQVKPT